ncbi:MAG: YqeG family HAD IIIA-type phosphatase [Capsulimonadales bacterium]|nr:YqeG family HAD IIIA-type phosphatase [Capsulimonadales bacterium]
MLNSNLKRLITPNRIVRHVSDVTVESLRERGVRAVVSDLDNTLVAYREDHAAEEIANWLRLLREAGFGVCLASNTRKLSRLRRIADHYGILHVPANCGKPGTKGLRQALQLLNVPASEAAMVGDQVFTDMVAGNRLGMLTILVNPLSRQEFLGTTLISRRLERVVLRGPLRRPE